MILRESRIGSMNSMREIQAEKSVLLPKPKVKRCSADNKYSIRLQERPRQQVQRRKNRRVRNFGGYHLYATHEGRRGNETDLPFT